MKIKKVSSKFLITSVEVNNEAISDIIALALAAGSNILPMIKINSTGYVKKWCPMSEKNKSIEYAFEIIDLLDEAGSMGVSELSTQLKLPKTKTHRVLKTLRNLNIVDQDKHDIHSLGCSMYKYSQGIKQASSH